MGQSLGGSYVLRGLIGGALFSFVLVLGSVIPFIGFFLLLFLGFFVYTPLTLIESIFGHELVHAPARALGDISPDMPTALGILMLLMLYPLLGALLGALVGLFKKKMVVGIAVVLLLAATGTALAYVVPFRTGHSTADLASRKNMGFRSTRNCDHVFNGPYSPNRNDCYYVLVQNDQSIKDYSLCEKMHVPSDGTPHRAVSDYNRCITTISGHLQSFQWKFAQK